MCSLSGSMAADSPDKKKKGKKVMFEEADTVEPFKPTDVRVMEISHLERKTLEEANTCIFRGTFYDEERKSVSVILPPATFFKLHEDPVCQNAFNKVGLEKYFQLPPWGVDIQRAYELMTSIDDNGLAAITDRNGVKLKVQITEELVSEALKLPTPGEAFKLPHQLSEPDKKATFHPTISTETFKDLVDQTLAPPLRLYAHHFAMGRPQKYTHPNKRVAGFIQRAMRSRSKQSGDFSRGILADIQGYKRSKGLQTQPCLAGGLMLTRIAYQAIGMIEELLAPLAA